jgi:hypothetical protein
MQAIISPIQDLASARQYIQSFPCPDGFSAFAWKELKHTALQVWFAHLQGRFYRGALNFCRPEFYAMLVQPNGEAIVPQARIRGYRAA